MQNDSAFDNPVILARAMDQLKLMRSAVQRIANSTGKGVSPAESLNGSNFVDPEKEDLDLLTELTHND